MKTAYATIEMIGDKYIINISVTDGQLTSGADGWSQDAVTLTQARLVADETLTDYCEDGECANGGIRDYTEGEKTTVDDALSAVMTAAEIGEEFGLAEATVRQAINRGQLPARKSAGTWLALRSDAEAAWGKRRPKTLLDILTGSLEYSSSWGIYAEKIGSDFRPESRARFGQRQFKNGGLLDDMEYFCNNERATDRINSLSGYTDGTEEEREAITPDNIREAAEMLIDEINQEMRE